MIIFIKKERLPFWRRIGCHFILYWSKTIGISRKKTGNAQGAARFVLLKQHFHRCF
jgi:hypothetical protein